MSDPVTNVEIEDVLASIRRLVRNDGSKDEPAAPGDEAKADARDEAAEASDRLVLTAEQRVVPQADEADEATLPADTVEAEEPLHLDASLRQVEPDVADTDEPDLEPHEVEEVLAEVEEALSEEDHVVADEVTLEEDELSVEMGVAEEEAAEPEAPARAESVPVFASNRTVEETVADLEAAVEENGFEPDGSEPEEAPIDWKDVDPATPMAQLVTSRRYIKRDRADDGAEEDQPEAEVAAETPAATEPETPKVDEDLSAYLDSDQVIDEEALRDLVVEIVREELQGALGERITRNVRKLVRREIHRVLSSQDFD